VKLGGFVSASRERDWGQHNPRGRPLAACETYQRGPIYHTFRKLEVPGWRIFLRVANIEGSRSDYERAHNDGARAGERR
jgi:hypothetical protein